MERPDPIEGWARIAEAAAGWLLAFIAALTFVSVILRYIFAWSIPDAYDISRNLLGIVIFWGIALAGYRGDHITVDLVWGAAGPRMRRAMDIFASLVTLGCMGVFAWMFFDKVAGTAHDNVRTFDLQLAVWPFFLLAWLGIAAAALLLALRLYRLVMGKLPAPAPGRAATE